MIFPPDEPVLLDFNTFNDSALDDPGDPDAVTLDLDAPDGTPHTYAWPGGDITRLALGRFAYLATVTPGHWSGMWTATGALATSEPVAFDVAVAAPYVLPADVRAILAGTGTLPGSAASLSDGDLFTAIYEAQAEVDGRLTSRYDTPFANTPSLVVNVTRDIAAYLATLTFRRGNPIQPGDPVQLRYTRAQTLLGQMATGAVDLAVSGGHAGDVVPATGPRPTANAYSGSLFGGAAYLRDVPAVDPSDPPVPADRTPTYLPAPYGY